MECVTCESLDVNQYHSAANNNQAPRLGVYEAVRLMVQRISETILLHDMGMPEGSFTLVFDGPADTRQELWEYPQEDCCRSRSVL